MRFSEASAVLAAGDGRFDVRVPDGWQQGRGAFGGLVLGTLARAMETELAEPGRRLRTLAGDIVAPVMPGAATVVVRRLRHAGNQTNSVAELVQDGQVVALASAVFSRPRPLPSKDLAPAPPPAMDWTAMEPLENGPPIGPVFVQHYEFRSEGPFPGFSGDAAVSDGFIRAKEREPLDAAAIVALLDSWWPAFLAAEPSFRPAVTVSFVAQLLVDPASVPHETPLRFRATAAGQGDGFVLELRELWSGDRLVATNQQTFAILK